MSTPGRKRSANQSAGDAGSGRAPGLREQRKARTRRLVQEQALRLFVAQGYESTTVAEIAAAAGVSHMTFFRYFPSKEAVVENDEYDLMLADLIQRRPADEGPLVALREAVREGLGLVYTTDREGLLVRSRLVLRTPALRARMAGNLGATEELFARALATRAHADVTLETRVVAASALAALATAIDAWVEGDGAEELPDLIDRAFGALLQANVSARSRRGR
ncbi:TetR family transcriptional regulator [Actinopolymorpha singaporensis]|uniref:DNA-binding transcriptional regulator, AcrR family n=1 Tax=Actinopolymorpha singaporensis TaxID=117157 RepID=A0A1H1P3F5_9ACTN|nr:TetR family transcriptional regulator [Actinopolymorpha singaporensis]SDS05778.1 DNA-binding transcriptional regulator, AcrR family [Actinopolymorpha singaporensis]